MSAKAGRHDDQYMVRFPPGLRDQIKEAASAAGRSMNSEIIARLEESFASPLREAETNATYAHILRIVFDRVASDMWKEGKSAEDYVSWVASLPGFEKFLTPPPHKHEKPD